MNPTPQDPFLHVLAAQLTDSGYGVTVHPPTPHGPFEWLESTLPDCFGGQDIGLRWLSLDDQSDAPDEEDDDEPLPAMALIRIDALLPFPIAEDQLPLTLATIEVLNDLLPFGSIGLRPHAQCWAWQYTMATPANAFNGLLALRVIDTLQFYLALLSPVLIAGFEQRLSPEALHESIRIALAEWVDQAPGQDRGAAS